MAKSTPSLGWPMRTDTSRPLLTCPLHLPSKKTVVEHSDDQTKLERFGFVNLLVFFSSVSGFFAFGSRNTNEFFGFEIFLLTEKIAVALERPLGQTQVSVDRD